MRWEDEFWVKIYVRDTPDWIDIGWEARAVFYELCRKVDRAGILPIGKSAMRGVALTLRMPDEIVQKGMDALLADGCVVQNNGQLVIPNYVEAQRAAATSAERKRSQRERAKVVAMAFPAEKAVAVTAGHAMSRPVTNVTNVTLDQKRVEGSPIDVGKDLSLSGSLLSIPCCPISEDQDLEIQEEPEDLTYEQKYAQAYERGICRGLGRVWAFPPGGRLCPHQGALNVATKHSKGLKKEALLAWIEASAEAFALRIPDADIPYSSGFSPIGFLKWLNSGERFPESGLRLVSAAPSGPMPKELEGAFAKVTGKK